VEPGGKPVRVRSVEVHGETVAKALAGQRTALGLHGVERSDIERGYCVVSPGDFEASAIVDVELALLGSVPKPLESRTRIRFHLGASETIGRVFLLGCEKLAAGAVCCAQIRLEAPVVAGFSDRYVLRTYSPMRTIGGGRVLDPAAEGHKRNDPAVLEHLRALATGDLAGVAESHIKRSGHGVAPGVLRKKLSCGPAEIDRLVRSLVAAGKAVEMPGGLVIHATRLGQIESEIETILKAYKAENRLTWGMPREELRERLGTIDVAFLNFLVARLEAAGRLTVRRGAVRAGSAGVDLSPAEARARTLTVDLLKQGVLQPPTEKDLQAEARIPADVFRKVVSLLVDEGEIVRLEPGVVMHKTAVERGSAIVRDYLKQHGEATAGDLKTALGTTRKYAVPLLEYLDRMGVTRRKGDKRHLVG
jgi:selenocysteine-specific elongation factor